MKKKIHSEHMDDEYKWLEVVDKLNLDDDDNNQYEFEFVESIDEINQTDDENNAYDEEHEKASLTNDDDEYEWLDLINELNPKISDYQSLRKVPKECKKIKVRSARKINYEERNKVIFTGFVVLLAAGLTLKAATDPEIQYRVRYWFSNYSQIDETNLDYAEYAIDQNTTISSEVKEYLLTFLDRISELYGCIELDSMLRITDKIAKYDFSNLDLNNKETTVLVLADIINSSYNISTRCLSREFYEYYFNTAPSKKSLLFDALNGRFDYFLIRHIINGGDKEYYEFLSGKYGYSESEIEKIRYRMVTLQVNPENKYDIDYYINHRLAFYSNNFGLLNKMNDYFTSEDIEAGNCIYNGNVFNNIAVITVNNGSQKYDVYLNKKNDWDVTNIEYLKNFREMMKDFDGNIDYENPRDRMITYFYSLILLRNGEKRFDDAISIDDYSTVLYSFGKDYLGNDLYSYLSNWDASFIVNLVDYVKSLSWYESDTLTEDKLDLFVGIFLCLQKDVKTGKLTAYDYEKCFSNVSLTIEEKLGLEALFNFQIAVIRKDNSSNVQDLIKDHYGKNSKAILELTSN